MKAFDKIYQRALERKGGESNLAEFLPAGILKSSQLKKIGDDRYLSEITKAVFKAGFVWKVIDNKWPNFEKAFWKFNVRRCCAMGPDDIDSLCIDASIVRNAKKIVAVQRNATFVADIAYEYGSFGEMMATWPEADFIGLMNRLYKGCDRLGIQSAQYLCRFVGRDGFVLSNDVVAALIDADVLDRSASGKAPSGKAAQAKIQAAFNQWRDESGRSLAEISRILALSIDAT